MFHFGIPHLDKAMNDYRRANPLPASPARTVKAKRRVSAALPAYFHAAMALALLGYAVGFLSLCL